MITINLLPQEYRRRERTPIVVFLPIVVGLVCVLSAASVAAYVHFVSLEQTVAQKRSLEADLQQKTPNLRYEESLLAEEKEYQARVETIEDIAASRILATKKLDQLWGTISAGDASGDYMVWLTEMKSTPAKTSGNAAKAKKGDGPRPGGEIAMKGFALADRDPLQDFNRFHGALKASPIYKECIEVNNPDGKVNDFNDERVPRKGWTVDLAMSLVHPSELVKKEPKKAAQVADKNSKKTGAKR